jgi:protein-S-isoprenylcysteine O-methyltransferase Ste14
LFLKINLKINFQKEKRKKKKEKRKKERMKNTPEFILKLVTLVGVYFMTLEYIFACEIETWLGCCLLFIGVGLVTIIYIFFRAGKVSRCQKCKQYIKMI